MGETPGVNADQEAFWNSDPARNWVRNDAILDELMRDLTARLLERIDPRIGERVIDIGCGTGTTTLAIAERVGPSGSVLGVDISDPMLERARERAAGVANVAFVRGDAQVHPFEPGAADLVASRFGVMFFEDPVAAFRNIAGALRPGGRICFVAWSDVSENPWFSLPRDAAVARLGAPGPQSPTAPGPCAFADRDRVRGLLQAAGLERVEADRQPVELVWQGEFATLVALATTIGAAARILREKGGGPEDEAAIRRTLETELAAFRRPDGVRVPAVLNFFAARKE